MSDQLDDVLNQLEPLRSVPARSDAAARSGLQAFLNEAAQLRPAVSTPERARPTGWKTIFQPARSPMLLFGKIMLIASLLLGGGGATVVAAQGSLPGDGLYPVKLIVEEARLALTADAQAQLNLRLELAQTRTQEMQQLAAQQRAIPDETALQVQTQLQAALQVAAQLDDAPLQTAMQQIETRVMTQAQALTQARVNAPDDKGLRHTEQILNQMQSMAQLGQSDPAAFRARFGPGRPIEPPTPSASHTPQPTRTGTVTHTPQATRTPAPLHTPQATRTPQSMGTPQGTGTPQGNSYGPGAQATPNQGATTQPVATPIGGGDGHEYGPGPQPTAAMQPTNQPGGNPTEPPATPAGNGQPAQTPEPGGNGGGGGSGGGPH